MGTYLNPGNQGFSGIRNDIYIDKSGLIKLINDTIDTPRRLTCISRSRRFGKSFAAQMLCAYYDKTCDSSLLFDDLEVAAMKRSGLNLPKPSAKQRIMIPFNVFVKVSSLSIIQYTETRML